MQRANAVFGKFDLQIPACRVSIAVVCVVRRAAACNSPLERARARHACAGRCRCVRSGDALALVDAPAAACE
jgi:hypothetical protein